MLMREFAESATKPGSAGSDDTSARGADSDTGFVGALTGDSAAPSICAMTSIRGELKNFRKPEASTERTDSTRAFAPKRSRIKATASSAERTVNLKQLPGAGREARVDMD